ncbi:MAG: hypothetical protein ACRDRL_27455 [Sciscionella sp.]
MLRAACWDTHHGHVGARQDGLVGALVAWPRKAGLSPHRERELLAQWRASSAASL